ncbi:MAG: M48 family metalloprotease [Leptospira sp.]|nr:M48 family metalloprotease [Leptospira sp.]
MNRKYFYISVFMAVSPIAFSCSSLMTQSEPGIPDGVKREVQVGRVLAARLAKKYGLNQNREFTRYLNTVARKISSQSSRQELVFHVGVLNTEEVNAFACPGGYIFITLGALRMIDSEAELAGVLAHEIGHVTLRHSGEFSQREPVIDVIASLLSPGGDIVSALAHTALESLMAELFEKGRSKAVEMEADTAGLLIASTLDYDVYAYMRYLKKMENAKGNEIFLKTHPSGTERLKNLQQLVTNEKLGGKRLDSEIYRNSFAKLITSSKN